MDVNKGVRLLLDFLILLTLDLIFENDVCYTWLHVVSSLSETA